ncbi:hypothetical protein [Micromonospora sp. SH-82]|uniref:hypothetical protein n=1 Tax=Micromonospora sp. SH-82 TaxID=3132938 RepID=UPI003EBD171E
MSEGLVEWFSDTERKRNARFTAYDSTVELSDGSRFPVGDYVRDLNQGFDPNRVPLLERGTMRSLELRFVRPYAEVSRLHLLDNGGREISPDDRTRPRFDTRFQQLVDVDGRAARWPAEPPAYVQHQERSHAPPATRHDTQPPGYDEPPGTQQRGGPEVSVAEVAAMRAPQWRGNRSEPRSLSRAMRDSWQAFRRHLPGGQQPGAGVPQQRGR